LKADLTGMTTYEELPIELKYIEFIEKEVEVPIKLFLWDQTENKLSLNSN
jgi:adenylosuccinate synthase